MAMRRPCLAPLTSGANAADASAGTSALPSSKYRRVTTGPFVAVAVAPPWLIAVPAAMPIVKIDTVIASAMTRNRAKPVSRSSSSNMAALAQDDVDAARVGVLALADDHVGRLHQRDPLCRDAVRDERVTHRDRAGLRKFEVLRRVAAGVGVARQLDL